MTKTLAIAQARMGSTRFPGKVMKDLAGKPVISWVTTALLSCAEIDEVVIATSTLPADDVIEKWCRDHSVKVFRGSETDVLDRFYKCALEQEANIILRITCDCPFIDPYVTGQVIQLRKMTNAAYCSNQPTWPDGLDVECFTFQALHEAWTDADRPSDRDCVTQYIIRNQHLYPAEYLICPFPGAHKERWVLDTEKDYEFCKAIAVRCGIGPPSFMEIMEILDENPEIRKINEGAIRNERFYENLANEQLPKREYKHSLELLNRGIRTIPFASQTYSKSYHAFSPTNAPLYVTHGDGARVFDVDGNDYVDLVGALLPVILGYRDSDVDDAVRRQLNRAGMSFSLATELEIQLAEKLCSLIPCAEMVKFGKSGTDVTSAAVRLARAYTGKNHILTGGYHGWADWSIGRDPAKSYGIPDVVKKLSHPFKYGESLNLILDHIRGDVAAVIVEPTGDATYLAILKDICKRNEMLLIFDEIQTGFRYGLGGAQEWYGVTPDLACFGKAMGNGMPISALVGSKEIMSNLHTGMTFYSGTFFGDTLSIAAALATIDKMEKEDVAGHLWNTGMQIKDQIFKKAPPWLDFDGPGCLTKIKFKDHHNAKAREIQSLFTQTMAQNGVLVLNAHGLSYAMKGPEVQRIVLAYEKTFDTINETLEKQGEVEKRLGGKVAWV